MEATQHVYCQDTYRLISDRLKDDIDITVSAVYCNKLMHKFLPKKFRNDPEIKDLAGEIALFF